MTPRIEALDALALTAAIVVTFAVSLARMGPSVEKPEVREAVPIVLYRSPAQDAQPVTPQEVEEATPALVAAPAPPKVEPVAVLAAIPAAQTPESSSAGDPSKPPPGEPTEQERPPGIPATAPAAQPAVAAAQFPIEAPPLLERELEAVSTFTPPSNFDMFVKSAPMQPPPIEGTPPVPAEAPPVDVTVAVVVATPETDDPLIPKELVGLAPLVSPEDAPPRPDDSSPGIGQDELAASAAAVEGPNTAERDPAWPEYVPLQTLRSGGNIMVMALLIDHTGRVLNVEVPVRSFDLLGDATFALSAYQTVFTDVQPPLAEGEYRWVEVSMILQRTGAATFNRVFK